MEGHAALIPDEEKSNNMYLLPLFPLERRMGGGLVELQWSVQPN